MKKRLALSFAALLCACCLGLAACGGGSGSGSGSGSSAGAGPADTAQADKEAIAQAMEENIAAFDEGKAGMADGLLEDESLVSLFKLTGIDPNAYADAITSRMTMETGDIKVDGDSATVDLVMRVPDYAAMGTQIEEASEKAVEGIDTSSASEEEIYAKIGEAIMSIITAGDLPTRSETFVVEYGKANGDWTIQNRTELQEAMERVYSYSAS